MHIDITLQGDAVPDRSIFANATRPPNQYEPPTGEEILKTWDQENFNLPFHDEDNLPYMSFSKEGMHAILHRPMDGIEYHAAMVFHENKGFIYICNCYTDVDANLIFFIGGLIAFSPFLLGDGNGSATAN